MHCIFSSTKNCVSHLSFPTPRNCPLTLLYNIFHIWVQAGYLHLVKPYMVTVQSNDVSAVNDALHEIYVEEEDYDRLRESIDLHDNFDQIGLAQKVRIYELKPCLVFPEQPNAQNCVIICASRLRNTSFLK